MISSDILFIFAVISGAIYFESEWTGIVCIELNISIICFIWLGISDFVIGLYCLFAFVLPLRKYIKLEQKTNGPNDLAVLARKILIFSGLMLISTMVITTLAAIFNSIASFVYIVDWCINSICIVNQFGNVDINSVPRKYRRFISCLQCDCNNDEKELIKSMEMSQMSDVHIGDKPKSIEDTAETTEV